jgi:Ca2+/Na+ antiporter
MTTFGTILLGGAFFLSFVAANINGKIPRRLHSIVMRIIIVGIVAGVVCMFQPISPAIYRDGFNVLMFSLLFFIIWAHLIPKLPSQEAEDVERSPGSAGSVTKPLEVH